MTRIRGHIGYDILIGYGARIINKTAISTCCSGQSLTLDDSIEARPHPLAAFIDIDDVVSAFGEETQRLTQAHIQHLYQGYQRTEIDSHLDGQCDQQTEVTIVLTEENQHGLIENVDITETGLLRRLALVMNDTARHIPVLVTCLQDSVLQVDILAIHEEILVQETNLIECLTTQHHESATHHLNLARFVP